MQLNDQISQELDKLKEEASQIHEDWLKLEEDKNSLLAYVEESIKEKEDLVSEIQVEKDANFKLKREVESK